jgi:hypothetical protein
MVINSPIFSGSISQALSAYANLSGSFTGSFTGSFKGTIDVSQASFDDLTVTNRLRVGHDSSSYAAVTGSLNVSGSVYVSSGNVYVDNVNVLDTALAYSIALG